MNARRSLYVLVFLAGVGTLATEICASRLLAPYYGSSTIVWANIIGLTLASLSLGYWLGGRVADRNPSPHVLGRLVLAAALLVAVIPFVSSPILDVASSGLDEVSAGAVIGSFFGTLLLFAPPIVLLGMVAPFAIRLALVELSSAGQVAGRLYALSTVGSLFGTFVPALITIPLIGTQRTLLATAALLAAAASTMLGRRWLVATAAIAALVLVPPGAVKASDGEVLYEVESPYQFVQVVERGGARRLYLNEGVAVHSLWRPGTVLTGGVWDAFLALPVLLNRPVDRVAVLGNAGGTIARAYGELWPAARIDGVEIDPAVSEAGREYLGLGDNPRLTVHDADARPFLRRSDSKYDLIVVDAYHQPYVPFYLATREFFRLVHRHLAPGGIVALNVATVPDDRSLEENLAGTLAAEFESVHVWPVLRFNHIVIGFTDRDSPGAMAYDPRIDSLVDLLVDGGLSPPVEPLARPWTDDRAPVEWVTDRMILAYAAEGGRLDEDLLPTAP
ncbi:MAG: fused MFS/spermidine synthase [Actinomycetota bacterium]